MTSTVRTFLRPAGAQKKLDIPSSTFWRLKKVDPKFPKGIKLSPGVTLFDDEELNEYMDSKREPAAA